MEDARVKLAHKMAGEITLSDNAGKTIRKWREIFKISQKDLAAQLSVNPSVISDYESGRRVSPGIKMIRNVIFALLDIDEKAGGQVIRQMGAMLSEPVFDMIIDIKEFTKPIEAKRLVEAVEGKVFAGEDKLDRHIFGYTIIDSLRAIVEFGPIELTRLYGATSQRALIFTKVSSGKSPMIAIKLTNLKPALIVFHGLKEPDQLAIQLAEKEQIPLIVSQTESVDKLIENLRSKFA